MARLSKNGTLSGMMGKAVLRTYNGVTFAYVRQTEVRNPQTRGQMMQRTKKQNIVYLYGAMKPALKDNFQGKIGHQSDYTMFVSCNLQQMPVYLTQQEALSELQVVAPYVVSFGKMMPIEYVLDGERLVSNIEVGNLELNDATKVMDLTASILNHNEDWKAGDKIEFISCRQLALPDSQGNQRPYAECDFTEITLETSDRTNLKKLLDAIELEVSEDGMLCMRAAGEGGFAIVHKRPTAKGCATGTQSLVVRNTLLERFGSEEHCDEAIRSYAKKKKR